MDWRGRGFRGISEEGSGDGSEEGSGHAWGGFKEGSRLVAGDGTCPETVQRGMHLLGMDMFPQCEI